MNLFVQNTFTDIQLAILFANLTPAVLAILIWGGATLYTITRRLRPLSQILRSSADHLAALERSDVENLHALEALWKAQETGRDFSFPQAFLSARAALLRQAEHFYLGGFLPSSRHYFSIQALLDGEISPERTSNRRNLTLLVIILIMIAGSIATIMSMNFPDAFTWSLLASVCLAAMKFLLDLIHWTVWRSLIKQHQRFCSEFDRTIPVLDAAAAATFEAARTTQASLDRSAQSISDQISGFATKLVTPALDAALERIADQQQQGMERLAKAFAHQLSHTVEDRMTQLSGRIGTIQNELKNLNQVLSQNIHGLDGAIASQRKVLDEAAQKMVAIGVENARIFGRATEAQTQLIQKAAALSEDQASKMAQLVASVEQLAGQNNQFSQLADQLIQQSAAIQQAVVSVDQTFDGFTVKMNDAMTSAGKEIAQGIKDNLMDSHEAIQQLSQQANLLRQDYQQYFGRLETQSQSTFQAMDLHVQNSYARIENHLASIFDLNRQETLETFLAAGRVQKELADRLHSSQGSIEQAVLQMTQLYDGITVRMNDAMTNAGREIAKGITDNISDSHEAIEKLSQQANQLREDYQQYFGRLEIQSQSTFQAMDQHVQNSFSSIEEHLATLLDRNRQETEETFQEANKAQLQLALRLQSSQDSIDQAVLRVTQLFDGITGKMNQAMATAGREIAQGIREVTADNADAIGKLTEQGQLLRDDYDRYFSNMETHSRNTFEEMDFHVQNIIAKVTEEVTALLERQRADHQDVLTAYKDGTLNLLSTFEEQANSINLYAKEINLDIGDLSANLKDSVTSFSTGMQDTVSRTLEEFDQGLAELSLRIANTVENIRDAVEELPQALGKR